MKKVLFILILTGVVACHAQSSVGSWGGQLETPTGKLRIIFNLSLSDKGYAATMDSPDQGARNINVTNVTVEDSLVMLSFANIQYKGVVRGELIKGDFTQGGFRAPLTLTRTERVAPAKSPQEPHAPFPYRVEDVTFLNGSDTLAGTLTMPSQGSRFPAVVLITGSGAQNRDEEIMGHKPFLVIADHLTRNGVAVLRYDDRGTGSSTGNFADATTTDFVTDTRAAVEFLKKRKEINSRKIGLIGHSEGGVIAPMVAASDDKIRFVVMLAGVGIRCDKLLLLQKRLIEEAMGYNKIQIALSGKMMQGAYEIIRSGIEPVRDTVLAYFTSRIGNIQAEQITRQITSPWFLNFLRTDPADYLSKMTCAVLALNGSRDLQVPPKENLSAIKAALGDRVTIVELPRLNHLFQECETGLISEYATIEQTFSPEALAIISDWIDTQL